MTNQSNFAYQPGEHEAESASNSYLMSLVAVIAGLPLPIVNLLATFFFFVANRKKTFFVRWHCTQALLSQLSLFFMNTVGFWWTISIMFFDESVTNNYIGYMMVIFFFNVAEFIATIYTAVKTRNGKHVEWFFYGDLTNMICKA
jgi:uncharacterized Tic20 family protein